MTPDIKKIIHNPVFFERNRIYRVYRGGKLFKNLFDDPVEDTFYPEEWIASTVNAMGTPHDDIPGYGISIVKDTDIPFTELLDKYTKEMLGDLKEFNIFAKILHSAVRLPVQSHPDIDFSRKYFSSEKGKEEAWLVLAVEDDAVIYYGFKDGVSKDDFSRAIDESENDKDIAASLLNPVKIRPGDVYFVPGKTVHTIGSGCLILEIQESTDFVMLCEHWCDELHLTNEEMFQGLNKKQALECFDFSGNAESILKKGKIKPETFIKNGGIEARKLISEKESNNFRMNSYTVESGSFQLNNTPSIIIPVEGSGILKGSDLNRAITAGEYFFMPHSARGAEIVTDGRITVVECLPKGC
ncbi:MAG: class I mannose-6-phosphate isomerase [Spirochaetales bacterium]|uniref:Class I mannose-6-phosphate isomerase n=1 Tax=Candidatus Thalassospirochaeta sargassi TaxID=3119039 RepID=A0AAJ1ICT9_9SPIO|nr:class I mannose-6-phosphate isomerase [Spirochaetales bacterium]